MGKFNNMIEPFYAHLVVQQKASSDSYFFFISLFPLPKCIVYSRINLQQMLEVLVFRGNYPRWMKTT